MTEEGQPKLNSSEGSAALCACKDPAHTSAPKQARMGFLRRSCGFLCAIPILPPASHISALVPDKPSLNHMYSDAGARLKCTCKRAYKKRTKAVLMHWVPHLRGTPSSSHPSPLEISANTSASLLLQTTARAVGEGKSVVSTTVGRTSGSPGYSRFKPLDAGVPARLALRTKALVPSQTVLLLLELLGFVHGGVLGGASRVERILVGACKGIRVFAGGGHRSGLIFVVVVGVVVVGVVVVVAGLLFVFAESLPRLRVVVGLGCAVKLRDTDDAGM